MDNDIVKVMNTLTGETGMIRRRLFDNPRINSGILVEVKPNTKPFVPELYTSKTPDEFKETYPDKVESAESSEDEEETPTTRKYRKKEDSE